MFREILAFSRFHLLVYYSPLSTSPAISNYLIFVYLYVLYTFLTIYEHFTNSNRREGEGDRAIAQMPCQALEHQYTW
jgi:hypothetical protein